jgi:hypothetical protein
MSELTPLERAALEAILEEQADYRAVLAKQLAGASALSRKNTGGGFFTDLAIASNVNASGEAFAAFGENVWISVDGLEFGLGMILHTRNGRASFLEGYAVAPEDTSNIDFESVSFALSPAPRAFLADGS